MCICIYNKILRLFYFPLLWKFSTLIFVPKSNKPLDLLSLHRSIILLPLFAKILERLILKRILPIIVENKVLPDIQFEFRVSHSSIQQVHRLFDVIFYSLEQKLYCTWVFLHISQAFDHIRNDGLLYKLKRFLQSAYYWSIINSYLTEWHFKIHYGSALSAIAVINASVPQGGILCNVIIMKFVYNI